MPRFSQCDQILALFRRSRDGVVSCRQFEKDRLYHKLSTRCSDLRKKGYDIKLIPSHTADPLDAAYQLVSEPHPFKEETDGQLVAFTDA